MKCPENVRQALLAAGFEAPTYLGYNPETLNMLIDAYGIKKYEVAALSGSTITNKTSAGVKVLFNTVSEDRKEFSGMRHKNWCLLLQNLSEIEPKPKFRY